MEKIDGLTQKIMAELAKVSNSTVSRYISENNILPIDDGNQRNLRYSIPSVRKVVQNISTMQKKIIKKKQAFYNFKGGTGKTSICFQVAAHLAMMGYNVLAIDADPQAHLSISLGVMKEDNLTLYDVICGNRAVEEVIQNIYKGLDCIPSNLSLTRLEPELSNIPKREERVNIELNILIKKYDFIFVDTNPTISLLNRNVIFFADILNIVCETQPYSLNGLKLLIEDLNKFSHYMEMTDKDINIIPNKYEDRSSNSGEAMAALKTYYSKYLQEDFAIRKSEDIVTSSKLSKPLAFFARRNSNAMEDIIDLVHYIIEKSS
jgi:chromosome partitioning protein